MKKVFIRYLIPLILTGAVALVACYYFLNFISINNIEIAREKFKEYNKEKQHELLVKNQVNDIKISEAALRVKWENLKQSINALNLLNYKNNEFGRTVYDLIVKKELLTQIYIVDNAGKKPHIVYGGLDIKGANFRNHSLVKKKVYNKLDYEEEVIEKNGKMYVLLCMPYYTGKLLTIFGLENFNEELSTVNNDNQHIFLLRDNQIIKHSDLKGMTKSDAKEMIKPYLDSLKLNHRNIHLGQHLAVKNQIFDNNELLLFSVDAVENDKSYKESMEIFERIFAESKKDNYEDLIYWLIRISLVTLLLGVYFAYTNSRPIIELKNKINKIIEGDYNARVKYKANNELDEVANSFNKMISLIQSNKEDLINNKNKLEESNKLLENFAYLVSHDLKQPIRNVGAFAQLLNQSSNLNEDEKNYVSFIMSGSAAMNNIVNGFLEFSSLNLKDSVDEPNIVDLNKVLQAALSNNEILIKEKNSKIEFSELPTVYGDEIQLTSLFQNLIANAVKFSEEDPHVVISSQAQNGHYNIKFKDNGIGIPDENVSEIFQLYKQAPGKKGIGHGIGLALCKKIVDLHKGCISVSSKLNEGSIFTVKFPANSYA